MSGKYSRDKGKRGELDLKGRLGGSTKRVGHSFVASPADLVSDFAVYQVRNKTIGGSEIAFELKRLEISNPEKAHYVAFKVKGKWYLGESLSQHLKHHGERGMDELAKEEDTG